MNAERKTGYYWVIWNLELDGESHYNRIGWYNAPSQQWYFPGDTRAYHDADLLGIYEIRVENLPGISWWSRILVWAAAIIVTWYAAYAVKLLIDYITK